MQNLHEFVPRQHKMEGRAMNNGLRGIEYLLDLNRRHSTMFASPGMQLGRQKYRAEFPTEIQADKCMDGRLNLSLMTHTALGIIQPLRNLGGRFDLGWIAYQQEVLKWVHYSIQNGRNCLKLITYHFDRHDKHRGCRGFDYDVNAAKAFTANLKRQYDDTFGREVVYAIQIGIDTFNEALVLHGTNGEEVDLTEVQDSSPESLRNLVASLYPDMPRRIQQDLLPLVAGNIQHIADVKASKRPTEEVEHREWVLAVGRGFDWLHEINTALIVGPFHPNLSEPIGTAAKLILGNVSEGRVNDKDIVLVSSAPYRETAGPEQKLAEYKARFLADFAYNEVKQQAPQLLKKLQRLTVAVDMNNRSLNVLERS